MWALDVSKGGNKHEVARVSKRGNRKDDKVGKTNLLGQGKVHDMVEAQEVTKYAAWPFIDVSLISHQESGAPLQAVRLHKP